jgi:DNA polymerase III subunit delta
MPPRAADKFVKDVAARDVEALRKALAAMADLEVQSRGGELSEDTEAVRAVLIATR